MSNDALKLARLNSRIAREAATQKLLMSFLSNPAFQCMAVSIIADQAVRHKIIEPVTGKGVAALFTGVTIASFGGGATASLIGATAASSVTGNDSSVPAGTSWWDKIVKYDKWPWEK